MNGKGFPWFAALVVLLMSSTEAVRAAPPWARLIGYDRVEADADKAYLLAEQNGPWMIMTCSFSGEGAEQQARQLVYELRKRYKLEAYMHRVRFDLSDPGGRGIDQFGYAIPRRYQRGNQVVEYAVLVGNYPAVDDPKAQRTLQKLKYSRPKCLQIAEDRPTKMNLAGWRIYAKYANEDNQKKGPMMKAFVTTNPLLPREYYVPRGVDELVLKMNQGVKHSLLDCPGRYSVQVAKFTGNVILNQGEIQKIEAGTKRMQSGLAQAAMQAHQLTEALRLKDYEAYEFHDRYASIVCVGSFDSVGTPRPDGKLEINPKVLAVMRKFGMDQAPQAAPGSSVVKAKALAGIPFDVQPIPVEVPKRSIGAELTRSALGQW